MDSPAPVAPCQPRRTAGPLRSVAVGLAAACALAVAGPAVASGSSTPAPVGPGGARDGDPLFSEAAAVVLHSGPDRPASDTERREVVAATGVEAVVDDGALEHPDGACSSPVPLYAEFEPACRTHDLGYEVLRAAGGAGTPLPPWARQAMDSRLGVDLRSACTARPTKEERGRCVAVSVVVEAVVRANSLRQSDGPPVHEDWPWTT